MVKRSSQTPDDQVYYSFKGTLVSETDKAIRVKYERNKYVWLPRSQIEFTSDGLNNKVEVTLPEWLVERNGLTDYVEENG